MNERFSTPVMVSGVETGAGFCGLGFRGPCPFTVATLAFYG